MREMRVQSPPQCHFRSGRVVGHPELGRKPRWDWPRSPLSFRRTLPDSDLQSFCFRGIHVSPP